MAQSGRRYKVLLRAACPNLYYLIAVTVLPYVYKNISQRAQWRQEVLPKATRSVKNKTKVLTNGC
jgi:hypothetical protein